jgi:hypothetical protein
MSWPAAVLALLAGLGAATCQAQPASRVEIPIRQRVLPNGDIRYTVALTLGGAPIEAMLDTGSAGLRLLPGALPSGAYRLTDRREDYGFTSGVRLTGWIATADAAMGDLAAPLRFEMVSTIGCKSDQPNCPASRVKPADYGLGGDGLPGQGFKAIIGVNMGPAPAGNPLAQLGAHDWIIRLPRPGETSPGALILNPTADDTAGFNRFALDPKFSSMDGSFHDAIAGCLFNAAHKSQCGPMLLDSGAPGFHLTLGQDAPRLDWAKGDTATFGAFGENGAKLGVSFTVGALPGSQITQAPNKGNPRTRISAGNLPFFSFAVLYDPHAGVIGLKPR